MKTIKEMEETFKPSDLVEYFVKEYPEQTWLEDALKNTTVSHWISSAYCYCNNKEGLKFRGNYHVNHPNYYIVVLDLYEGNVIGGIEFVGNIEMEY